MTLILLRTLVKLLSFAVQLGLSSPDDFNFLVQYDFHGGTLDCPN